MRRARHELGQVEAAIQNWKPSWTLVGGSSWPGKTPGARKPLELLCPMLPSDSAAKGMQAHPSSEHLASLTECFLSSAAAAAAVAPVSKRTKGFSGR